MTFFNPKEDVLDIELTQYGKRSLSRGEFKPSYYLFFDDDILYDFSSAASDLQYGGTTAPIEEQNNIKKRLQERTPRLRTQYSFSEMSSQASTTAPQKTFEKHFALANSLGTSDPGSDSFPRWNIRMFGEDGPKITKSIEYMTSSFGIIRIPQNDVEMNFKTSVSNELGYPAIKEDPALSSAVQADSTYISVQPRTILMQVLENHAVFEKENFDIEVFIKDTETGGDTELDNWTPLLFKKKVMNIVDNILLDEQPEICHELDPTYVEYYFDIFVDGEISESIREQITDVLKTQNMYVATESTYTNDSTFEIADIYSQVVPDDACHVDED